MDDFACGLATNMVSSLLMAIGRRIGSGALGDAQQRDLADVTRRASAVLLVALVRGDVGNRELLKRYEEQFGAFFDDSWVAETLVGVALDREELPVGSLRAKFSAMGFDPDALPMGFDGAMAVFVRALLVRLEDNASGGGALQALVDRADLRAIRGSVEAMEAIALGHESAGRGGAASAPPPRPQIFVGRERALAELKERLLGTPPPEEGAAVGIAVAPTVALTGAPGIGKTALAAVATAAAEVGHAFPGGVHWVFLGPDADVVEELGGLARRLGAIVRGRPRDLAEAQGRVAAVLPGGAALLVVDDAFSAGEAAAFRLAGDGTTLLATTRDRDVARQLSAGGPAPLLLEELGEDEALELLSRLAPKVVEAHEAGAVDLVRELGGMPLAVRVAGGLLAAEERMGWGVEGLLTGLREGRRVLESEAPADRLPGPEGASPTVAALLRTSLERLSAEAVDRFRSLGAFPAKPTSFDVPAAASVWATGEEAARDTIRDLEGRGLLEPARSGRFYLHPILSSYARLRLEADPGGVTLHEAKLRHARHYRQVLLDAELLHRQGGQSTRRAVEALEQEMAHVAAGQRWAEERCQDNGGADAEASELCVRYAVCAPDVIGKVLRPSERQRWLEAAVAVADLIGDEDVRRRAESHLATAYTSTAENDRALGMLERHLERARSENDKEDEIVALGNLAIAHHHRHEDAKAEDCYRRLIGIAREIGSESRERYGLQDLALSLDLRGDHRAATRLLRDVLARARDAADEELEAGVLHRLASNQADTGHPRRSAVLARASVLIYDGLGDEKKRAYVLNSLGSALAELGEAEEAGRCYEKALELADDWEQAALKATATGNLGDVAKNLEKHPDRALSLYGEQIRLSRLAGDEREAAGGHWHTAEILRQRPGQALEALEQAREASRLFEKTGDPHRDQVWSLIREIARAT